MKTTKTITVSNTDILDHFVSLAEDCTIAEARALYGRSEKCKVTWDTVEVGDHDRGTYRKTLKSLTVEIER